MITISKDCNPKKDLQTYLDKWTTMTDYVAQEKALHQLFSGYGSDAFTEETLLIKCATLNDFYSTNIFKVYYVVQHYLTVPNLAQRLKKGDLTLVEELRRVPVPDNEGGWKTIDCYSFATKFCAHHEPDKFPICDKLAKEILYAFSVRDNLGFTKTKMKTYVGDAEHKDYTSYIETFKNRYHLNGYTVRQIDRYLWLLGRELS